MTRVDRILDEVMELTDEERSEFEHRLAKTTPVDPEIEKAWMAEVRRRFADHAAGKTKAIPWEEARRRIFSVD